MLRVLPVIVSLMLMPVIGLAKDKESSWEEAIKDEIFDSEDHQGKGRPDNPGEHGRDNAARKQAGNPGKGSDKDTSLESAIRDEIFDEDDDKNEKGKGKKKNK